MHHRVEPSIHPIRQTLERDITEGQHQQSQHQSVHARLHTDNNSKQNNRVHHDISIRFKDNEIKYSGLGEEDIMEFLNQYDQICEDPMLSAPQKLH